MRNPDLTPYQRREVIKQAMWQANARAVEAKARAQSTNDMRDQQAAYEATRALRHACEAYAATSNLNERTRA